MSTTRNLPPRSASELSDDVALLDVSTKRRASDARVQSEPELKRDRKMLETFVECVPAAIAMLDRSMRYVQVSDRWLEDYGLVRADIIGRSHYDVFPHIPARWKEANRRCLEGSVEQCDEDRLVRADGTERWLRWEIQPWGETGTDHSGILIYSEDITERKRTEIQLRESEAQLRFAQAAAHVGTWEWDPVSSSNTLSPELMDIFGVEGMLPPRRQEVWFVRVHPDDRSMVTAQMTEGQQRGEMEFEYRYLHPQRGLRRLYCRGRRLQPESESMFGVVMDITERKLHEDALRRSNDDLVRRVQNGDAEVARLSETLRFSDEGFGLLVDSVRDYAIFMLDTEGHVMSWNRGAERIKGYRPEEIVGRHFSVFYPPEESRPEKLTRRLKMAAEQGSYSEEGWRVRKGGARFWANITITAIHRDGVLRGFAKVTRDVSEQKRAEEAIRELSGRLLQSQDETQRRLARDLHDSTGQILSALALNLVVVKQAESVKNDRQANAAVSEAMRLIDQASGEIRTMSYLLHPPLLDEAGLYHAVNWYIEGFVKRTNIKVSFQAPMDAPRPARDVEMALFRVMQESLTNIHRHAESDRADIQFVCESDQLVLRIRDYGKGMPPQAYERLFGMPATLGVGLRGMFERVRQLGGYIDICPENPGTLLRAVLPLFPSQ